MPLLKNQRYEQFAQLVAGGKSPSEAYTLAGYSGKGAAQSANRLNKDAAVAKRIEELRMLANSIPVAAMWLSENYVMQGLKDVFTKAMEMERLGDAVRALELMGKRLGLFTDKLDHTFHWDGDVSKLDDGQLENLTYSLERLAYGEDRARIEAERRKVIAAPAPVSRAAAEVVETTAQDDTLEVGPDSHIVAPRRTWLSELERLEAIADRGAARAELRGLLPPGFRPTQGFLDMNLVERAEWLEANCPLPVEE